MGPKLPPSVGFPDSTPSPDRAKPAGRVPEVREKVGAGEAKVVVNW